MLFSNLYKIIQYVPFNAELLITILVKDKKIYSTRYYKLLIHFIHNL